MRKEITYKPFGKRAILIEWEAKIDEEILNDIVAFKTKIESSEHINPEDIIQGYHSLTLFFKDYINFDEVVSVFKSFYNSTLKINEQQYFLWEIPVCYDVEFGIDLKQISKQKNIAIADIIKLHTEAVYTVYFIGFLPGFLYLGGLNEQLFVDRKSNPRLNVAKGSVGIGGKQTGVYPNNSAGGWNIIGKTPVDFFDVNKDNPCFAKAGDVIQFKSISLNEFYEIENQVKRKEYEIAKTLQNA